MIKSSIGVLLLVIAIIFSWLKYPELVQLAFQTSVDSNEKRALFGDSYGSLNTLFSGLAFAGIIVSIFLQSQELRSTRAEIRAQKDEFQLQTKAMDKQVFETTFFQLLLLHNEIIQALNIERGFGSSKAPVHGRDVFSTLYQERFVNGTFLHEFKHLPGSDESLYSNDINGHYLKFHKVYGHMVGHYFRNIYQILKYVDSSKVEDKKFYSNLLRAQLSDYELGLLFYNCLSDLGNEMFKPLIEKYEFFEHLHQLEGIENCEIGEYKKGAFGKTNAHMIKVCVQNTR
ncbi:hypothetical protein BCV39_18860 [Vibrio sp. 10N.286.55.E10]|uniref:putative phage abortive infection protein n=1 Tax=unclassified Vibrio TaxID=2614977 RepID=UPI000C8199D4|nr:MULTISPECIES: putative phage abortive infection protein [unclassified Vibrio]PME35100.1 hypothetical protein BCV39_18860 [Vibrio sp. 10N.286.55.E10]PME37752.1 hypothetical protein BCV40_05645 [Vibrio sp. 10N.286.55.E12]PME67625.1 hypothetical protein BCV32_14555 [Vibrio sp. 10N.286.55.C11]